MANINLLLKGTFQGYCSIFTLPLEDVADIAQESGHTGLEVHPMNRTTKQGRDLHSDSLPNDVAGFITSGHQGFRRERNIREALQHPNKVYALGAYFLLPESSESLHHLADLQQAVGRDLPIVLYPYQYEQSRAFVEETFETRMFQPGRDFNDHTGTKTIGDVVTKLSELNGRACVDIDKLLECPTYVGKREDGFPQLEQAVEGLADSGLVSEVHFRVGAIDNPETAIDTLEELQIFLGYDSQALKRTTTARTLMAIRNSGICVPVVNEVQVDAIQIASGYKFQKPRDLVGVYSVITDNIRELLV